MSREVEFRALAQKYGLIDARLCGDAIFVSSADYWKWANMASFGGEPSDLPALLRDIGGFQLYFDSGLAGTGLTVEIVLDLPGYLHRLEAA